MSLRPANAASNKLSRVPFELQPARTRRTRLTGYAAVLAALLLGAAATHLYWRHELEALLRQSAALQGAQQRLAGLEQSRLLLQVSEARGHELEHQIDTLNQAQHACQEELTFFRKARDGRVQPARSASGV